MITRFIKGFNRNVHPRIMGGAMTRSFSMRGKTHNDKTMEYMLRSLESKRRIKNEKDLKEFSDVLFSGFISLKSARFHNKNVFYARREEVSSETEHYISGDRVYTMDKNFNRRLDRLGFEFGDIFKMLNDQLEALIAKTKINPSSVDDTTFLVMFGAISKLLKSINRFPNFIIKKKNLEQLYRLGDIVAVLLECKLNNVKSKKSGNLIISVMSSQYVVIHMCENLDKDSELYKDNVEEGYTQKMREQSYNLLLRSIDSGIEIDMRGLLGIYQSKMQLGDNDPEFIETIRKYVKSNVANSIDSYPNGTDFPSLSITYNKIANIRDPIFDEEIEKINNFLFDVISPDYKNDNVRMNIEFRDMATLLWGLTKHITENRDLHLRKKIKEFFHLFIYKLDGMRITNFEFLSINKTIESMVILNIFDNESSLQMQKLVYSKFSKRKTDRHTFTNYISLVTLLLRSGTKLDGRSFELYVSRIEAANSRMMFPKTVHDFISSFESANEIKRIYAKGENRTNDEELVFKSFLRLIEVYHAYCIDQSFKLNNVTMARFYRIIIQYTGQRSEVFEKCFIQKSNYFGKAELIMATIEVDLIISEINEIQSQEIINELVEDYDFDEIFITDDKFRSSGAFLQALSKFNTINYNLKKSQVSRNFNNYPHITKFIATERRFLERFLEQFNSKNIANILSTNQDVRRFSTFLHELFQAELKLGYENSQKNCMGILEICSNFPLEEFLIVIKPICLSSSSLHEVLEETQKRLTQLIIDNREESISIENVTSLLSMISLKSFFNEQLEEEAEKMVIRTLREGNFDAHDFSDLLNLLTFLEECLICFHNDSEVVELVSQRLESLAINQVRILIAEKRGSIKVNFLQRIIFRTCFFYEARDTTPEQKARAGIMKEKLEEVMHLFEEESGSVKRVMKDFFYTNLQNKTKEILDELEIKYEEEEYIGPFLVDFFLPDQNTVVEVTGPIHYVAKMDELNLRSKFKIDSMRSMGYKVITLKNEELVEDMEVKKTTLLKKLE